MILFIIQASRASFGEQGISYVNGQQAHRLLFSLVLVAHSCFFGMGNIRARALPPTNLKLGKGLRVGGIPHR